MEFVNAIIGSPVQDDKIVLAKLIKPFAPHLGSELLEQLGSDDEWPHWDEAYLADAEVELVVQVNGKLRARIMVNAGIVNDEAALKDLALAEDNVKRFIDGKEIRKIIIPKGAKLINIVVT